MTRRTAVHTCGVGLAVLTVAAALAARGADQAPTDRPLNVLVLVIDDARWDTVGAAGNPAVQTPRLDRLAAEGVRFENAFVTTSICMVSRASILTGQYMSRHGISAFGVPIASEAWTSTYPAVLRQAGYWTGFVGKYGVGAARPVDFDFLRSYETRHWFDEPDGERVHVTEKNARDALEFLRTRPSGRPFALSVSFFAAHAQDNAPEQYLPQDWSAEAYRGRTLPPPLRGDARFFEALPPFLKQPSNEGRIRFGWRFDTPARYQDYLTRYYRLVTEVDQVVGRLLDELEAQGVADDTLVVYIGDNGYFQADRGLADKWYPYEESIRVPLIVRDPRLPASRRGMVTDAMALNIDVAPTVVAAARAATPAVMQGQDLAAVYLRDQTAGWRDEFFYEHPTITSRDRIPSSQAVVRRDWKYVSWPEFEFEQLFNLREDPGEIVDLARDPEHEARREEYRRRLDAWKQRAR
jgi:arylsulfatase A-like enzyme